MSLYRNFTFTLNNYQDKPDLHLSLDQLPCRYMKYGKEVSESGTPHLQGMVVFKSQTSLKSAVKKLGGCHVEIMKSLEGSLIYCSKDGDITERGDCPMSNKAKGEKGREYYQNIIDLAEQDRIDEIDPQARLQYRASIRGFRDDASKKRKLEDTDAQHEWYYGPPGSGKSRKAREENPEAYLKMCNKWWDGYEDEEVVLIEDLDVKHEVLGHHLKIWGDRYPHLAEYKGGAKKIRPQKIIVTSNFHPEEIFQDEKTLGPILRRFKCIQFGDNPWTPVMPVRPMHDPVCNAPLTPCVCQTICSNI